MRGALSVRRDQRDSCAMYRRQAMDLCVAAEERRARL